MNRIALVLAALIALPASAAPPPAPPVTSISYETGPCFGFCPVYRVIVHSDGTALYQGIRHVAVQSQRRFRITRAQFLAFAARLQPIRPARGSIRYIGPELCGPTITDMPSVEVGWIGGRGRRQSLYYYYGCNPQRYRAMADRLRTAPELLPIGAFIARPRIDDDHG